jgi:hypothetical protein
MRTTVRRTAAMVVPVLLPAILCSMLVLSPRPVQAQPVDDGSITLAFMGVTSLGGGLYQWNYTASESASSALDNGVSGFGQTYITIYDAAGLVSGSESAPSANWSASEPLTGYTGAGVTLANGPGSDSSVIPNVTWLYTGPTVKNTSSNTIVLGNFSFRSTQFVQADGQYSSLDDSLFKGTPTKPGRNSAGTTVPAVPAPNAAAVMFMALSSGMGWLRLKRYAAR